MTLVPKPPAVAINPSSPAEVQALVAQLQAQIQSLELKNQKLVLELAHLKRIRFGTKSEALSVEQKRLFEDDADQDLAAIAAELDEAPASEDTPVSRLKPRPRAGRQPLPEHLERVEVRHEPEHCTCGMWWSSIYRHQDRFFCCHFLLINYRR